MERMSRKHHVRRRVFRTCGVALIASVVLAATPGSSAQPRHEGEEQLPLRAASRATPPASPYGPRLVPVRRLLVREGASVIAGALPDLVAQRTLKRIYAR